MSKTAAVVAAAFTAFALFFSAADTSTKSEVQISKFPWIAEQCTEKLEIECAIEIERTVKACAKAFQTSGADIIADIKCAKDLMGDKKFCWPCICSEAKKKGWHVIGC